MEERIDRFERMLQDVQGDYARTANQLEELKRANKTKSATFKQLLAMKMNYQYMLSLYRSYNLLDE